MPLTLITGPAGSGKTGEMLDAFTEALAREPVFVVPTGADVQRYEEELLFRSRVPVGGRIVTFSRLVELVARACGVVGEQPLTSLQRQGLMAAVARETRLTILGEPARRAGFPAALDSFVAELQAALVPPDELARRLRGGHAAELAALYQAYCCRRDGLGRSDNHVIAAAATDALAASPGSWNSRPVFIHGFDDLTPEQLALTEALAAAGEVTFSVVHEPGRACLVARQRLVDRLSPLGDCRVLAPVERGDALSHLERSFLTDSPEGREAGGQVVLFDAAGELAEVELVAQEVARLLRSGERPDDICVISRSPGSVGDLVEQVFGRVGIPVAVHAHSPFGSTSSGRALIALVRALFTGGGPADLIAYLRCPGRARPGDVDELERRVRLEGVESVDEALTIHAEIGGRALWEIGALQAAAEAGAAALLGAVADLARDIFEYPRRRTAPVLDERGRADQLAAEQAATALGELAELCEADLSLAPDAGGIVALLTDLGVARHRGAVAGRVELMSPYRARARQYPFVFVIGLQEGVFPRARTEDPFLAEPERIAAGLPPRADQRDEERFLFYACITRPLRRLHLSYRSSDEEGAEAVRSFFVDDVLELLAGEVPVVHRGLSDTVFDAADAPAERDVARALALRRESTAPDALGASETLAGRLKAALGPASRRAAYIPGSLSVPYVLEEFGKREAFGASSLEEYWSCPFRYLVGHELRPWPLEPVPESLTRGSLVHEVLELVYRDRYVGSRPEPADVEAAIEHARELLAELAPRHHLDPVTPRRLAGYRRIESDIVRFLRWDAEHPLAERVVALEGSFGGREDDEMGALELEGLRLHGKIDRIDAMVDGGALIRDYKTGASVTSRAQMAAYGKLQLQLYLLAARRLWNLEPAGGVYHALGSQRADNRPRGILRGPIDSSPLGSDDVVKTDFTEGPEEFEAALQGAADKAGELALKIQTGYLRREPIGGSCPRWCDFHTICRMERGEKNPDDDEPRWDQENGDG